MCLVSEDRPSRTPVEVVSLDGQRCVRNDWTLWGSLLRWGGGEVPWDLLAMGLAHSPCARGYLEIVSEVTEPVLVPPLPRYGLVNFSGAFLT